MGFSRKTGISLASGFKYQAQSPLDLRRVVDTIAERDELVTINAAWEGMHVYVKTNKKTYEYRGGTTWIPVLVGSMYTHPTYNAKASGLYKITVDGTGHVSATTAVTKADITALGIPGSDTKYGVFKAATADAAGAAGLVPAPAKGAQGLFLRGDNVWAKPTDTTYNDATTSAHGLMTAADKTKLNGIATNANNYVHPASHSIDMITETTDKKVMTAAERTKLAGIAAGANKYTHPSYTARASGLYKVTVDGTGHVSAVAAVTKADITALGIPSSDTWRGIQNNLTSTAADQSLSAAQGKWLNENKATITTLTNENLDKVTTPGFYNAGGGNSVTNKPSSVDNFGMIVVHSASGDYYTQIVYAADKSYRRACSNGTWGNWSQDILTDTKYTHPTYTAKSNGLYKVTVDGTGHISGATAVTKSDITALGIPGQDTNTTYNDVTTTAHGLMTAADKVKLNGIAAGANKYTHPSSHALSMITETDTLKIMTADERTKLAGIEAGANKYTHPGYTAKASGLYKVTVDGTGHVSAVAAITKADITGLGIPGTNTTYNAATTTAAGLMSAADKSKLDGIAAGANKFTYTHPAYTARSVGLYKVTVDATGHVSAVTAVAKADITALGIPGSDTWRGIQNNLTSDSTSDSLSAAQGKVLKGLVDGKAASSHTHNYAGSSSAGGVANSAAKLATARTVSGGTDITMSFNYDGSANSGASLGYYSCSARNGNTNNYPFHRFAKINTQTGSYIDKTMTVYITQDYNGGCFGIARLSLRTNNVSSKDKSSVEVKWLVRYGFAVDAIQIGHYNVAGATYADAFLKLGGTYAGTVIRAIANGARGGISRTWELINSSEADSTTSSDAKSSTESYVNIATAATKLHSQAYSETISSTDAGTTSYSNSAGRATQDSVGQQINTTYIKGLSVSGRTITYTKGDGTTGTITTQDTNTTYGDATTSAHGLMTAADKSKLNGIAANANNYSHPTSSGNKHIPSGGSSGQILRWSADGTAVWGNDNNTTYNAATTSAAGLMSASDKSKLDGIASGANKYSHPGYTARSSGLYKITVDGSGHVSAVTAVAKADITALGIPASDTNTWRGIQNNLTSDSTSDSLSAAQGKALKSLVDAKVAKSSKVSTTIKASSWSGSGPYTNTISVSGVTTSNNVEVLIPGSATDVQVEAWMSAGIVNGTQVANSITLKAYGDKPSIDIPIECIIRKDI